jgi:ferritin-like metal-binding protein YciE
VIEELLVEELRDLVSAEGQLVKAPEDDQSGKCRPPEGRVREPPRRTKAQVERLKECFTPGTGATKEPKHATAERGHDGKQVRARSFSRYRMAVRSDD